MSRDRMPKGTDLLFSECGLCECRAILLFYSDLYVCLGAHIVIYPICCPIGSQFLMIYEKLTFDMRVMQLRSMDVF